MATFTVTNTWNGGAGSLRKAIVDSNKTAGADKIEFDSSLSGKKINLKSQLVISDGLTIDGDIDNDGTPDITVDAKQISRVFNVDDGKGRVEKKVTLEGLTITGGQLANYKDIENSILDNDGAGILNKENLTVTNSVITGNNTLLIFPGENNNPDYILAYGGGIRNSGTLTISNSILHNNRATLGGGISNSGVATINSSIISGNEAERGGGGGINNDGEGNLNISSSLIYDNSAYTYGAGIFNSGNITVSNSTLTANFSHNYSNGFALFNRGNARVLNSTIAGSSSSGGSFGYSSSEDADLILRSSIVEYLDGDGITAGNSLIENAEDASIDVDLGGNILGQVAGLDPVGLQDNGGPTPTIALLPNSPAINAGDNPLGLINDQRGTGFSRVVGGKPDIGAFEVQSGGPSPSDNPLLFSLKKNQTINGLAVKTDDIVQFDGEKFSTFFDGSDVGLGGKKPAINAFDVIDDKKVLLSFERNFWLKGFGNVNRSDVLLFEATSLGHRTRGRFSKYFDGSDVGLNGYAENIDGLTGLPDGNLLISTRGNLKAGWGYSARNEDVSLFEFSSTSTGDNTEGTFSQYFDGGDVGLGSRRVNAFALAESNLLLFSTDSTFRKGSLKAENEDVFAFEPRRLGTTTRGSFVEELFFDGSQYGLQSNDIFAVDSTFNTI